jgi:GntR family transcriptional regulator
MIDHTDPRSPARQIADHLRTAIDRGEMQPGDKLPSARELVERYKTSVQTAQQAINQLKVDGLVTGIKGSGIYVRTRPPVVRVGSDRYARWRRAQGKSPFQAEMESLGLDWHQEILELAEVPAPDWVAQWLAVKPDEPVWVRRRRTWIEDTPTQLADSYYRLDDVRDTAIMQEDTGPGGAHARLEDKGLRITKFREEITVRMPRPDEVRALQLRPGVPTAELHRITFSDTERPPVEVFCSVMAGDRHIFCYEFPAPD